VKIPTKISFVPLMDGDDSKNPRLTPLICYRIDANDDIGCVGGNVTAQQSGTAEGVETWACGAGEPAVRSWDDAGDWRRRQERK